MFRGMSEINAGFIFQCRGSIACNIHKLISNGQMPTCIENLFGKKNTGPTLPSSNKQKHSLKDGRLSLLTPSAYI